jgi:hypothetical protein
MNTDGSTLIDDSHNTFSAGEALSALRDDGED